MVWEVLGAGGSAAGWVGGAGARDGGGCWLGSTVVGAWLRSLGISWAVSPVMVVSLAEISCESVWVAPFASCVGGRASVVVAAPMSNADPPVMSLSPMAKSAE